MRADDLAGFPPVNAVKHPHQPEVTVMEVIEVRTVIGDGVVPDPIREVADYYAMDGAHIFRVDHFKDQP